MHNITIIFLVIIVGLTSCRTSEQITSSAISNNSHDSVVIKEVVRVDTIRLAADSVMITTPVYSLQHDTIIKYRSRNASLKVEVTNGQLKATANCDSLERLVLSYEKSNTAYHKAETKGFHSDKLKIVQTVPWYYKASFWILIILTITGLIILFFKTYLKTVIPWN